MAVLKHIASKNSNYGEALDCFMFQHNEITVKPILDEQGRMQYRTEYYMNGVNCEPMSFGIKCEKVNMKHHNNLKYDEIKSHHYIISFDPKDSTENGLTSEKLQTLGLAFYKNIQKPFIRKKGLMH